MQKFSKIFLWHITQQKFNNVSAPPILFYLNKKAEILKTGWQRGWVTSAVQVGFLRPGRIIKMAAPNRIYKH